MHKINNSFMYTIAVGILMLILLIGNTATAAIISVPDDYARIQWAVDNATGGNTIEVQSGTYYENLNLNKKLILRGIGMPVVDAMGNGSTITLFADGINLEGFTATGSGSYPEAGIRVNSSNNTLTGNNASNNIGNGISMSDSGNNTLIGNNASSNKYYGIELIRSAHNKLSGNKASKNNNGIYLDDYSDNNSLMDNIANSNNYHGIKLYFSVNNIMTGNNASNNLNNGFNLDYSSNNTLKGNIAISNLYEGIYLSSSDNNMINGNNASNNLNNGFNLDYSSNNTLRDNAAISNLQGIYLSSSRNNTIYNNYFSSNNAFDDGNNIWNISKNSGTNIIDGAFYGGNFWSDYAGNDIDGDGLGDTMLPYNSSGEITNGGDYLPLTVPLPFTVKIKISETPIIVNSASNILVEFINFSSGDPYNISINAPDGTRVYYENASLTGTNLQTIPIKWTPQSEGNYTIEAWSRGMIDSTPVNVYDREVVPVSDLGIIVLITAVMLGAIGIKRRSK